MTGRKIAMLFPGQGAFHVGAWKESYDRYPEIREVFSAIDAVAMPRLGESVKDVVFGDEPQTVDALLQRSPGVLQLAIYGISVATGRVLQAHGVKPAVLLGHSLGEVSALVSAGCFSVPQGAEIICHGVEALGALGPTAGTMVALATDADRAEKMVHLVGAHEAAVAACNHDAETVISGTAAAMEAIVRMARVLKISHAKLLAPYPFHSPLLNPVVSELESRLRSFSQRPARVAVFSPILNRYYVDEDVLTEHLAGHLVRPVRFSAAIHTLARAGMETFVECGALNGLTTAVRQVQPDADLVTVAPLDSRRDEAASLRDAIQILSAPRPRPVPPLAHVLLRALDPSAFSAFWSLQGPRILEHIADEFEAFDNARSAVPAFDDSSEYTDAVPHNYD